MSTENNYFNKVPNSYWISSTSNTDYAKLKNNMEIDVAIIGGGLVGIVTALFLQKSGQKVAIYESDRIGCGTSGHTTAKITSQHGLFYHQMINELGMERAKAYAQSNEWAISLVENLVAEYSIDCDFVKQNAYIYTQDDAYVKQIQDEVAAAKSLGIHATYEKKLDIPFPILGAVKFENQGQFHPRKYIIALADQISKNGGMIFENTPIKDIDRGDPCKITTKDNLIVYAKKVVVACHFPFTDDIGLYFARMYQERSYIIGLKVKEELPDGMYISAESPTRSLRTQPYENGTMLLVGGENHKTGHGVDTNEHYKSLYDFASLHYTIEDMPFRWSAQDLTTPDKIPYIGNITSFSKNVYIGTGFKKWGMTSAHVAARMISDLILQEKNEWEDLYNPSRKLNKKAILKLINQNSNVAKDLIKGKIEMFPKEINIQPGQGDIFQIDGEKIGVYMDENNKLFFVDTTCTHMGCTLKWNSAEKSWDCPCHGSRFDYKGNVIDGPAYTPINGK